MDQNRITPYFDDRPDPYKDAIAEPYGPSRVVLVYVPSNDETFSVTPEEASRIATDVEVEIVSGVTPDTSDAWHYVEQLRSAAAALSRVREED